MKRPVTSFLSPNGLRWLMLAAFAIGVTAAYWILPRLGQGGP